MRLSFGTKVEWLPMARSRGKGGHFRIYGLTWGRFLIGVLVDSPVKLGRKEQDDG